MGLGRKLPLRDDTGVVRPESGVGFSHMLFGVVTGVVLPDRILLWSHIDGEPCMELVTECLGVVRPDMHIPLSLL